MNDELQKLLIEKERNDKKQRTVSFLLISVGIILVFITFYFILEKQKTNKILVQTLDTTQQAITKKDSLVVKLTDTLVKARKVLSLDAIECLGAPIEQKSSSGLQEYNFTMAIKDNSLIDKLASVGYYFNDATYRPKLKISTNRKNNFKIAINNSWGCMPIVPVYLTYLNKQVETINFPMCDRIKITVPKLK